MTRRRHTPDQIIRKLAEGHKLLGAGTDLDEVCRHVEIADSTWHRWVAGEGGAISNAWPIGSTPHRSPAESRPRWASMT